MTSPHTAQIHALHLAIAALEEKRRRNFAAGDHAYRHGMRSYEINADGITGVGFGFAEEGHKSYVEYSQAISQLEDLIEIILDPGVVTDRQMELFEK